MCTQPTGALLGASSDIFLPLSNSQPAHSWVRAVSAPQADLGLGLMDGETTKLKLGGDQFVSGADLTCKDGRSLDDHVADLVAPQVRGAGGFGVLASFEVPRRPTN